MSRTQAPATGIIGAMTTRRGPLGRSAAMLVMSLPIFACPFVVSAPVHAQPSPAAYQLVGETCKTQPSRFPLRYSRFQGLRRAAAGDRLHDVVLATKDAQANIQIWASVKELDMDGDGICDQVIVVSDPVGTGGDRDVLATVYIANQGTWRRIGARSAAKSDRPVDLITMRTPADGNFAFDEFVALRRPGETRTYLVAWAGARVSNGFVGYRVFEIEPAAGALVPVDKWKDDGAQLYAAFKSLSAADGRTVFDAEIEAAELRLHCNSTLPAGEGLAAACAQLPR